MRAARGKAKAGGISSISCCEAAFGVDSIDLDQFGIWKSLIMNGMAPTLSDQDIETFAAYCA